MKLKDLIPTIICTYHFKICVIDKHGKMKCYMYDTPDVNGLGVDDMEVVRIDMTCEVSEPSYITHTVSVRPIFVISVLEAR